MSHFHAHFIIPKNIPVSSTYIFISKHFCIVVEPLHTMHMKLDRA